MSEKQIVVMVQELQAQGVKVLLTAEGKKVMSK